jgi:hypothetical protein
MNFKLIESKAATVLLLIFCASVLLIPALQYSWTQSKGNLLGYNISGSYYTDEIELTKDLATFIPKNSTFLTYGFDAFYYLSLAKINYIELYYGQFWVSQLTDLSYIQNMVEAKDIINVKSALTYLNIHYMLLPTHEQGTIYSMFERFNEKSNLFKILEETNSVLLLKSYGSWDLYQILY